MIHTHNVDKKKTTRVSAPVVSGITSVSADTLIRSTNSGFAQQNADQHGKELMILGPMSYLDCLVFCILLAPQLIWHVGLFSTGLCVLQMLPFFCNYASPRPMFM